MQTGDTIARPAGPQAAGAQSAGGDTVTASASPRLRLLLVGLGISVVPLDTAVNIAFPDITGSFGLPIAMIQWVIICYVLTHAGLMLASGRAGDMWGHGAVFRIGLGWSVAAFLLCAAAPSFGWLLFFRVLQGLGAGLVISCAPALVTSLYPEARRTRALGVFTLMFALASAVGPLIGGALVARWGWPAVFWFRAPIALASLLFLRDLPPRIAMTQRQHFDIAGALLAACGLVALLFALRAPSLVFGLLLLAVAGTSLVMFVWWEGRAVQPIVRIDLFRNVSFAVVNLASCAMQLVAFSVMLLTPYFLARYTGLPLPLAGGVLASGFIAMAAASPLAGAIVPRIAAERAAPLGAVLAGAGLLLVGTWDVNTSPLAMVGALALQGIGMGLFQVAYMDLVMAAAPASDRGVAGSLSMLTRTIGVVAAAAGLTLAFQSMESAAQAGGADTAQAFLSAYRAIFRFCGIAAMLTGGVIAWFCRRRRRAVR